MPERPHTQRTRSTPGTRDPFIDAVRTAAVIVVVFGHWLVVSVYWDDAGSRSVNALSVVPWVRMSTWLTQVMPLLFFAGGFANATIAARLPRAYLSYLRVRLTRLMVPTAVLFGVWTSVGVFVHIAAPPRADVLAHAAFVAAIPLWFLGLYVITVALAPALIALHHRFGLAVPFAMVIGAGIVDALVHAGGIEAVGPLNYAFVWLLGHQMGIWYRHRGPFPLPAAATLAALGLTGMIVLTTVAGYPVSMVGVPGQPRWNTDPPSLAIVALTAWLIGLVLLLRGPLSRLWAERLGPITGVRHRLLTLFLWHVTAIPLAVFAIYPLGFPQAETGTSEWWAWRPVWILTLGVAMFVLVRAFGRFEVRARSAQAVTTTPIRVVGASLAVFSMAAAILGAALTGFSDPFGEGRELLVFRLNPFQNTLHLLVGGAAALLVIRSERAGAPVAVVMAALFTATGWLGLVAPSSLAALAWNEATAILHLVIGAAALALVAVLALFRNAR